MPSRPREILEQTKIDLKNLNLKYNEIILGATSGQRFLVMTKNLLMNH